MKYSGIKWIGEIPDNWNVRKVKQCFYISKEQAHEENPTILSLARAGVKVRDISNNEGQLAASYDNYNPVMPGDLLLNPMDLYSGANCSLSEVSGVISPAYINLRKKVELNPKFYDYFFKTQYWAMAMFAHGKGVSFDNRWTMNAETLLNYYLPFPSSDVQDKIVDLINKKTAEIDSLIEIENQQIEKLKEYKQAVITEAVTKGLDNNVSMKDSGIEWIGNIPEETSVIPLKFLLAEPMMYGANESGLREKIINGYRYIRITDIDGDGNLKDDDENQYLTQEKGESYNLSEGDILFARSGTVGKTFIYHESYGKSAFAGYLIKGKCDLNKLLPEYLYLYTQSSIYELWKQQIFIQSTIQNIGANKYSMLPLIVGSLEWQKQVTSYVQTKAREIDELIIVKQQKIDQLSEYKKSLIYEYVTGKKEVC